MLVGLTRGVSTQEILHMSTYWFLYQCHCLWFDSWWMETCQFQTDLQEEHISLVMDILILNNCYNCFKEEWTTITSPYYLCSECCVPKCPECQETEVMFVVNLKNDRRETKILMCLNVDCLYSEDGPDADRSNASHSSRRWSLKQKHCVSRKLNFDLWEFFLYHRTNSSWGIETLFHLSFSLRLS